MLERHCCWGWGRRGGGSVGAGQQVKSFAKWYYQQYSFCCSDTVQGTTQRSQASITANPYVSGSRVLVSFMSADCCCSDNDTVTVTMDSGLDPTEGNVVTRFFRKARTAMLYGTSVDVHKVRHTGGLIHRLGLLQLHSWSVGEQGLPQVAVQVAATPPPPPPCQALTVLLVVLISKRTLTCCCQHCAISSCMPLLTRH
jgi:hypothetical protein